MSVQIGKLEKSLDGERALVQILIDGHPFQAVFVRLPDGKVSDAAMHVGGLSERADASVLEARFHEEAARFRRENEAAIEALLRPSGLMGELAPLLRDAHAYATR